MDSRRIEVFSALAEFRRPLQVWTKWTDPERLHWAGLRVGRVWVGLCSFGPSWTFDPFARSQRVRYFQRLRSRSQCIDDRQHEQLLHLMLRQVRLGKLSGRLLTIVHARVLADKQSVVKIADVLIGRALWGGNPKAWPRHWRQEILRIARGLTYLHIGEAGGESLPALGMATPLLTHVGDLRGTKEGACSSGSRGM